MGHPLKENSLTSQDVIKAAIDCLDQEGSSALGVNRVARALGIKPPAIYKHLDGNAGLTRAVALAIWRNYLLDLLREYLTDVLVQWIRRYILFHNKQHPKDMGIPEIEAFLTHFHQTR
jgi:AcrR family transcriptional regulator